MCCPYFPQWAVARRSKHVSVPASTRCWVVFIPQYKSPSPFKHLHLFSQHTTREVCCPRTYTRAETKAKASVLFPEPFSTSDSQQRVPCPPSKGWSIFHCLKLPRPQGAGGNKTVFDLAKGGISEVKGQSEEFITAAKAAKIQAPDQKLPSCSAWHDVQPPMCLGGPGCCREHSRNNQFSTHRSVLTPS